MKISVLTCITNPKERQDRWKEAFACYKDFADELVVVDGGDSSYKDGRIDILSDRMKVVYLHWPYEWSWIELPKHLNAGRKECTGEWIIKLDIDQFIHENDFENIRNVLETCPNEIESLTFQKMSTIYKKKYYEKGGQPIAFRNNKDILIGKNKDEETDLCFAIKKTGYKDVWNWKGEINSYQLPVGTSLVQGRSRISYWNYDYFFKTKDFIEKEFWRFSRAYYRYFQKWTFGKNQKDSFDVFLKMHKGRYDKAPYTYTLEQHPKYIREEVKNLTPEQFGYNGFNI